MHCYYIPTPFVIEIALCVGTKSSSLGMQWYEMPLIDAVKEENKFKEKD